MSNELITKYEAQLPKVKRYEIKDVISNIFGVIGVIGVIFTFVTYENKEPFSFNVNELFVFVVQGVIILSLLSYLFYREVNKRHRYSEAVYFIAHSSQLIKDFLRRYREGDVNKSDLDRLHEKIANNVSNCFSLIKGKKCSVCIKTIEDNNILRCLARDANSDARYSEQNNDFSHHTIMENTDFSSFFLSSCPKIRYYLNNNLKKSWLNREYKNSSFFNVGEPRVKNFFGYSYVKGWRLAYNSTLICPIRHITSDNSVGKHYLGFLCLDSSSRNMFNDTIDPELLYCFANQIYLLESEILNVEKISHELDGLYDELEETYSLLESSKGS
ncbi:hypothetical protein V9N53_003583 [Vibrio cholerae]